MRRDGDYLSDIARSAQHLALVTSDRGIDALSDRSYLNDVVREILLIGQACRELSDEFKSARPAIPWRAIVAMRNLLVHRYHVIDDAAVWEAATVDVPELIRLLGELVAGDPSDPFEPDEPSAR